MGNETIKTVEGLVQALLAGDPGYFLVDVRIKPTNNIRVYIDGDQGFLSKNAFNSTGLYTRNWKKWRFSPMGIFPWKFLLPASMNR